MEVVRTMENKYGVPEHWNQNVHKPKKHPGSFEDCEICLRLFNDPRVITAVRSVQVK